MLGISILGETEVRRGTSRIGIRALGGAKPRRILEILVLADGRTVGKDRLADLVWDGVPPPAHTATLDTYVCVLRKHLEPARPTRESVVVTTTGGYRLDTSRVQLDVDAFDELVARAAALPAAAALACLDQALALVRGELLEHEPYAAWAEQARAERRSRLVDALLQAGSCALELGDPDRAVASASRVLAVDELCERAWRLRIRSHWAAGRRSDALADYDICRDLIASELGLAPAVETRELLRSLRGPDAAGTDHLAEAVTAAVLAAARRHPRPVAVPGDAQLARWADLLLADITGSGLPARAVPRHDVRRHEVGVPT